MTKIKCPRQSCKKEFEKPVLVTNFIFTPTKETYLACPYCLTRIESNSRTCNCPTVVNPVIGSLSKNEQEITPEPQANDGTCLKENFSNSVTLERIGTLEKQKEQLLTQVEELKQGAIKKISKLEEEIADLKEEKQALEQLTN
ncbi:MAG: hypothetical protein QCH99_02865 [Candidatus Bathyarchaeota archaeon]|nr:hypothetical protein [Candidatus Bathyarchaeum tardum]